CNTENPDDAQFCSSCGADLVATSAPVADADPSDQEQAAPLTSVTPPLADQRSDLPGFQVRFAAFMIDFLLVYTAIILLNQFLGILIASLVWPAYFVILTIMYGQTPGKRALKIRVVDHDGNLPLPRHLVYRELYRFLVVFFSVLVAAPHQLITFGAVALLLMGHLAVVHDPLRRAWHDRIAGTYVVRVSKENYIPPDHQRYTDRMD
ncbi:MAG: RDD family protein, partial [Chloroflexi bacterium]|nr:RDD family protein [Chloroflexota bacterium]